MAANPQSLYALIREIRAAFQDLKALTDALHADRGLTASMRAVLEHLADEGPATVPQIARSKNVTRQHIQTIVDDLKAAELVVLSPNPAHRRSPLVSPSPKGDLLFAEARAAEASGLLRLASALEGQEIDRARVTLQALRAAMDAVRREEGEE